MYIFTRFISFPTMCLRGFQTLAVNGVLRFYLPAEFMLISIYNNIGGVYMIST